MRQAALSIAIAVLAPSAGAQILQFTETSQASGVSWAHVDFLTPMGAGCAFFDANLDGRLDLLFVGGSTKPGLFLNQGGGTFANGSAAAGLFMAQPGKGHMGAFAADVDGDADDDLFLTVNGPNKLYRSNGNATFSDVTAAAGLSGPNSAAWAACAAFADYDTDGDLDLFVGNYVTVPSQPTPDLLYANDGTGTFTDVTALTNTAGNGTALACQWTDFDQDGDVDLLLGNDLGQFLQPNQLYRNDGAMAGPAGSWAFVDVAPALGADASLYTMGVHGADIDHDLDFDYYFSNIGRKLLLRNDGAAGFVDDSAAWNVEGTFDPYQPGGQTTSWGLGFHDFDSDGFDDLYVAHGYITPPSFVPSAQNVQNTPNQLYQHNGAGHTYTNVAAAAGVEDTQMGRGCAFADYDQDGDVDIAQANVSGTALLYRNDTVSPHHWLKVRARGRLSTGVPLGAFLRADAGGVAYIRELTRHYSYLSTHDPVVHFGLGTADLVDQLTIHWPRGIEQHRYDVPANAELVVKEPYLAFDATSTFPATVAEGNTLAIVNVLRNHTGQPRTGWIFTELRVAGVTWTSPVFALPVPADGTTTLPFSVPVPPGITGGQPLQLEFTWNLYDATIGHDQWRNVITITP